MNGTDQSSQPNGKAAKRAGNDPFIHTLRFILGSAGRVSQRVFLPLYASVFVGISFLKVDFFIDVSAAFLSAGYFSSALPAMLLVFLLSTITAKRVFSTINGWFRHLPVNSKTLRRSAVLAVTVSILPVLILMAACSLAAAAKYHFCVLPFVAGLPLLAAATALILLPTKHRWLASLSLILAGFCYSANSWILLPAGLFLHGCSTVFSEPVTPKRSRRILPDRKKIDLIIIWRALGCRLMLPYLLSFIPCVGLILFLTNNSSPSRTTAMAVRLSSGLSLIVFCAAFAWLLVLHRPLWPWRRSLPESSQSSVTREAALVLFHLLPLLLPAALLAPRMTAPILTGLPALLLLTVESVRIGSAGRFGVVGFLLTRTLIPLVTFALVAWTGILYLLMTPWLFSSAVTVERSFPVSGWLETVHLADGDSQSWSA